jgi:hypothetical protein
MKHARARRYWKECIGRGRRIEAIISNGKSYKQAIEALAEEGRDQKSAEKDLAVARQAERWLHDRHEALNGQIAHRSVMDIIFVMAKANLGRRAADPELFSEANKLFTQVIEETEAAQQKWRIQVSVASNTLTG